MKQLKNIKQYLVLCLIALLAGSCSDWLDGALPVDKNLEDKQYSTEASIDAVLNGIYRSMSSADLYGGKLTMSDIELLAHYYYYNTNTGIDAYKDYVHFLKISAYDYDEMQNTFSGVWSSAYSTIFSINTFMKNLEQSSANIDEDRKKILFGEACGLRAFLHFDLLRIFGDKDQGIPYNDSPEVIPHKFKTTEEIYNLIYADIAKATDFLKNDPIVLYGIFDFYKQNSQAINTVPVVERFAYYLRNYRMNYYAVLALKARVLMHQGKVKEASELATSIMEESKLPFKWSAKDDITKDKNPNYIFYTEVIFGIFNPDLHTNWRKHTEGSTLGSIWAVHIDNLQDNIFKYDASNSEISSWADVRSRQWVASKIGEGQYVSKKFDDTYDNSQNNPKQYFQPLMRISELVYIVAEDMILDGNIEQGITLINSLLSIRGVSNEALRPVDVDKNEAFNILETEYYKEFYGEGQVYFYLKRRNSPQVFRVDLPGKTNVGDDAYLVPVPKTEKIND